MRISRLTILGLALVLAALCGAFLPTTRAQTPAQYETLSRCGTSAPSSVKIDTATSGNVELVALAAGKRVYVCGFDLDNDTATTGLQFITGTGTACATNEADLTGVYTVALLTSPNAGATQFVGAAASALCIELSTNTQVNGRMTYVQY